MTHQEHGGRPSMPSRDEAMSALLKITDASEIEEMIFDFQNGADFYDAEVRELVAVLATPAPTVSLAKAPSVQPSEWELDRRRTVINPTLSTLNGHREGLNANDPFSLASALKTLASIHPRSHAWNRQTLGRDAQMWAGHLS